LLTTGCPHFLRPVIVGGGRVVWGCGGGAGGGGGGARARPAAGRVALRIGPALALAPFPLPGRSSLWTASFCWGGWLVLLRGCDACRAVFCFWKNNKRMIIIGGDLQSEAALIDVLLDVGSLPPSSSSPTVAGCRLGGFSVGRDWWGGQRIVEGWYPALTLAHGVCVIVYV
jgi:hypothetical protein